MTDLNSMSFEDLVPTNSKYLKQSDVGEGGVILTVRGFKQESLEADDGSKEDKIVLYFMEPDFKPMVLNKTNAQLLALATGAKQAGDARGKTIIVYADPSVGFGGKMTGGLRIRKHTTVAPTQPRSATQALVDMPNDIPTSSPFDDTDAPF